MKSYLSAFSTTQKGVSLEFDSSPLNMMETTWEQVDITALGPNWYLCLKNTAKICILIHTPYGGEQDCKQETEIFLKSTYFGIFYKLEPQREACLETHINWQQNNSDLTSPICKWVMTQKMTNSQWTADHLTTLDYKSKQIEFLTVTFVRTFSWSTGVLVFHHRIVKLWNFQTNTT